MRRRVVKEFDKSIYAIDIMLYVIMGIVGYILLEFSSIPNLDIQQYIVGTFFVFGFISLLAYFLNRRKGDYEFLIFGLINIFVACFIKFNSSNSDLNYIVASSLLFYSLAYFLNKICHVWKLLKEKNLNSIPKISISVLVVLLTLFTMVSVYTKFDAAIMIYGYYFMGFALLSIIEVLLIILFNGKTFRKKMIDMLNYDDVKVVNKTTEIKKMKPVQGKRIKKLVPVKETKDEVIIEEKPKKVKKTKKKVKKDNK